MGGTIPWAGVLGCIRKPAEHEQRPEPKQHSSMVSASSFGAEFLPRLPSVMG